MKLSFSTKGWTGYSWSDYCDMAIDMGFDGIELHDIHADVFCCADGPLHPAASAATIRQLLHNGLSIPCLDTLCNICDPTILESCTAEIREAIASAARLGIPYVRMHATGCDGLTPEEEDDTSAACIAEVLAEAKSTKVILLVETCGIYADTARLCNLLNRFASGSLCALWDLNHPYRFHDESAETTIQNLGAYIKHVHVKDSMITDGELEYCLIREGTLPLVEMFDALRSVNYDGFFSLELDPADLGDLGIADIVFSHYVNCIEQLDRNTRSQNHLLWNETSTGRYVWKKDIVIEHTFPEVLDRMVAEFPDQYAFKYTTLDYTRTYSEFRDDVDTFARSLISMGVKPGDKVAIWATNVPQWFITFWATTKIGAILVTVNTAYKIHEAEYLLRQSDTHTLVMTEGWRDSNYSAIIAELCPELENTPTGNTLHARQLPFLRNVITVGFRQKGCMTWEEALARADRVPIEEVHRRAAAVDIHDVCNMQYTSGTTGFPKGVMLTHYNVVNNGKYIGDHMDLSTADRMMVQVPMFHCFGMVLSMTASMTHGATLCPLPYFSPKSSLACINQERITCFNGVPTMFIAMMQHDDFAKTDFSYIRTGIMAGSNCPPELMRKAADIMNMQQIVSVYGQTEASPGCTMSSYYDSLDVRTNTVGSAFANVECKIVDPETGLDCPDNVTGEFVARGYNIMKGYYKMPQATASTIDADGWLHSGDLACRDKNGNYHITGRLKDMIIRGGENIYPREIEEFIFTHPSVKDVQVIGVPDKRYGEEIMACIILHDGCEMTVEEMKTYITEHMARHKVPRYIDFVHSFPMNAAGKILKYKMREDAIAQLNLEG
ncbi:MAG: AMP-binding protein [Oscillospiraceae bacterium]|jgi:fatty-acyl-CoA synthase